MVDRDPASEASRQGQFGISRGMVLAVPLFAVTILVCAALSSIGWWMVSMIAAVLAALSLVPLIQRSVILMLGGLMLCTMAGIMGGGIETPLFGGTVNGIRVDQAGEHRWASIFHFIDGRVLAEDDRSVPVYAGTKGESHVSYRIHLAPIVGDGWMPGQPVTVWAVSSSPNSGMPRGDWSKASRAGVRAVNSYSDEIRDAIDQAGRRYGLTTVPDPILIHWLDDPEAAVTSQYARMFTVFCVCTVVWIVLIVITLIIEARARRRAELLRRR